MGLSKYRPQTFRSSTSGSVVFCLRSKSQNTGREASVRTLLEHGCDIDLLSEDGETALGCAAYPIPAFARWSSHLPIVGIVRALVEHGCDLDRRGRHKPTPLISGIWSKSPFLNPSCFFFVGGGSELADLES